MRFEDYVEQNLQQDEKQDILIRDWTRDGVTLRDLQQMEFAPLRWIIDDIMPAGATLMAGKPKMGKSWFALNLGLAVALKYQALGRLATTYGEVLYLDLENTHRRMKKRVHDILGNQTLWPRNVSVFRAWPRGDEGVEQFEDWMIMHPGTVLVVIDILQNFRPFASGSSANQYEQDTLVMQSLSQFAGRHNIAVLVLHHTRKAKADYVFDEIAGSTGLTGGTDTMLVLANDTDGAMLHVKGRDIEKDHPKPLAWNDEECMWNIVEQQELLSDGKKQIFDLLADAGEPLGLMEICRFLPDLNKATVQSDLQRMVDSGILVRPKRGRYTISDHADHAST